MKIAKVLGIILGILIIIGGFSCLFRPGITFLELGWVLGACMLIDGVSNILTWFQLRKYDQAPAGLLVLAGLSAGCGLLIICSGFAQLTVELFVLYSASFWLICGGFSRIMIGLDMRRVHKEFATSYLGSNWLLSVLLGILLILIGMFCIMHPVLLAISIGTMIGFSIISAGVSLVGTSLALVTD